MVMCYSNTQRALFIAALAIVIPCAATTARQHTAMSLEYRHRMNDQRLLEILSKVDRGHARIRLARAEYELKLNTRLATTSSVTLFELLNAEVMWLKADFDVKRGEYRVKDYQLEYKLLKSRVEATEGGPEDLVSYAQGIAQVRRLQHQLAVELAKNAHPFADRITHEADLGKRMLSQGAIAYEEWEGLDLAAKEARGLARLADESVIDTASYVAEAENDAAEVKQQVRGTNPAAARIR